MTRFQTIVALLIVLMISGASAYIGASIPITIKS